MTNYNLAPGDSTGSISASVTTRRPPWLTFSGASAIAGTAQLPSGHRRIRRDSGSSVVTDNIYVYPVLLPSTEGPWRMAIYAPNGSYITADGLSGIPTIGTPKVRLADNAPAKAVVKVPVIRKVPNILASSFAGWSDGHTEAVKRGMELTVEYRNTSGNLVTVFRGMIYQIDNGDVVEITAYDRVMDLYQFSDQYQSHQGRVTEWVNRSRTVGSQYEYIASANIGTMTAVQAESVYRIDALSQMSTVYIGTNTGFVAHDLPHENGWGASDGSVISRVSTSMFGARNTSPGALNPTYTLKARPYLYKCTGSDMQAIAVGDWQTSTETGSSSHTFVWTVNWTVPSASSCYIGVEYQITVISPSLSAYGYKGSTTRYTTSTYYKSSDGSTWTSASSSEFLPEIGVDFTQSASINLGNVTTSDNKVLIDISAIPVPDSSSPHTSVIDTGIRAYLDYFEAGGTPLQGVVKDLIEWAGLIPNIAGSIDMGATDYYTSSTFDYLTCIQEIVNGGNVGIRMPVSEPGRIDVLPRHNTSDTPVTTFSTRPNNVSAEKVILSHDLTSHWTAEKATVAMLAENATSSGLPIALETDDGLMDGSLSNALQSPLRGISADATMGTHTLMAYSAGGKVRQLHTNTLEGNVVLAGYRTDLWDLNGSYAGGNPIKLDVPDEGMVSSMDAVTVIPTEIEFSDGVTSVTLDNVRRNERSELARSMGLTADNVSNSSKQIPNTCWIFAKVESYATQGSGIASGSVTEVKCLLDDGTVAATQNDGTYIKTLKDPAGYFHVCAVFPSDPVGYATNYPIARLSFVMGGNTYNAVIENGKYALGGQAIHIDIRFKPSN